MAKNPQVEQAITFLATDCLKKKPTFVNTIFSGKELVEKAGLTLSAPQILELMRDLEYTSFVRRTNKVGVDGSYYNISSFAFVALHKQGKNTEFVKKNKTPEEGLCIIFGKKQTFRLNCAGRKCRFWLAHEKKCVMEKFFVK